MTNCPLSSKFEFLKQILSGTTLTSKTVLDAGTGAGSAQFLAERDPQQLVCVALPGDLRKGNQAQQRLQFIGFTDYELIYGDLSDNTLFVEESFDFMLADYLIGELHASKIDMVLQNLFTALKPNGEILFVDREPYFGMIPSVQYLSTGHIKADPQLRQRPDRDLIDVVNMFMWIPRMLTTLLPSIRTADYSSKWVCQWLKAAGFKHLETSCFDQPSTVKREFEQRLGWAQERIYRLPNRELCEGLLQELNKVVGEYTRRGIAKDENFFRTHYVIRARKS
jgi:SAM-dependent methyltransferase